MCYEDASEDIVLQCITTHRLLVGWLVG
jgi:hypothetical protein